MKKGYTQLAIWNILLGICAICLYLPYTLDAFDMAGFDWFKFVPDMLKDNYSNVLINFGIFLLLWFIILNAISILYRPNLPKILFKVVVISALILPLIYVLALKQDWAFEFWVKNISSNIKNICYILLGVSCGSWILALIFNFTRNNRANLHHIIQGLTMSILLILFVAVHGWCGWELSLEMLNKLYGLLVGLFAIYLPLSSVLLWVCRSKRV
ncbi:MAG: hypothetical protein IJ371_04700 [Clostridia bacterium]|nr:hypothetical protein [Clostridia bacterium]